MIYETNASSRDSLLVCLNYLITCMWSKTSCLTSFVQPIARLDDDPFLWAAAERQRVDELRTVFTTSQQGLPSHLLERGQWEKWFAETVLFDLSSWKTRQSMIWLVKTWSPHHPYSKETGNRKGSAFCETPSKEQVITTTTKKKVLRNWLHIRL